LSFALKTGVKISNKNFVEALRRPGSVCVASHVTVEEGRRLAGLVQKY